MKNAIKYYYGIEPSNIHQKDKIYYFVMDNVKYVLVELNNIDNIKEIYDFSNQLIKSGVFIHQIILNISSQIVTIINDKTYILLKIYQEKKEISINDIINFNNIGFYENKKLQMDNWYLLWINKIDYFEYQINQIGKKHPLIIKSFSYYVGLSETAISLIKNISFESMPYSLCHRRMLCTDTFYNLYDPLNIIIDLRIRDICEYFKSGFFNNEDVLSEIKTYLFYNKLNYDEACCFLARLLFPTYYFDTYEKIINNEIDETYLNNIISKVDKYEMFLKSVYLFLKSQSNIPTIEWLENINLN